MWQRGRALGGVMMACGFALLMSCVAQTVPPPPSTPVEIADPPQPSATAVAPPEAADDPLLPELLPIEETHFDSSILNLARLRELVQKKLVPEAPSSCRAWVTRRSRATLACDTKSTARAALDAALDPRGTTADEVDARLAALESCNGLEPGFVRAVRIERAPRECADALTSSILAQPPSELAAPMFHALYGSAVAALAERVDDKPAGSATRAREALGALARVASDLPPGWGRGVALAAVAAAEIRQQATGDIGSITVAARAAVEEMGATGISSSHIDPALSYLAVRFGWLAEIDVLRGPDVPSGERGPTIKRPMLNGQPACPHCWDDRRRAATETERLVEELPPFLSARLLSADELLTIESLRGFARRRALPIRVRAALASSTVGPRELTLAAIAQLSVAVRFLDRRDADRVLARISALAAADRTDDAKLALSLATALHAGPRDLASYLREPPHFAPSALALLDIEASTSPLRAIAELDAGVLRELESGPTSGDLAPLREQLERYRRASTGDGRLRERQAPLALLLRQLDGDPGYNPAALIRFNGWPIVQPNGGAWSDPRGTIGTVARAGSVNRALRRASSHFETCYAAATGPASRSPIELTFTIAHDGSVASADAHAATSASATLATCLRDVAASLSFVPPDFGPWSVSVHFP